MAEINPAGFFQALSTHTAEQFRSYLGSMLTLPSAAASLKTASGVHPGLGGQLAVTQNGTPNMSVNIAAGFVFVTGTEGTKQGTYFCENDAVVNKSITASDPTNPRIDIVVAKIQDAFYSGATNAWSLAVVTGTPAGSPAVPTAPANSVTLAQIAVAANATTIVTGNITDKRPFAAALGGALPCTSLVRPANPYEGLFGYETDTNAPIYYDGTRWFRMGRQVTNAAGKAAISTQITGMDVYETDTGYFYFWNGSKWIRLEHTINVIADQSWSSNVTPQDPTTTNILPNGIFGFAMDANSRYDFICRLQVSATIGVGLSIQGVQPTASATDLNIIGVNNSGTYYNTIVQNATTTTFGSGVLSTSSVAYIGGVVNNGANAGNFKFQFCQGVSNAAASFILKGSGMRVRQVS